MSVDHLSIPYLFNKNIVNNALSGALTEALNLYKNENLQVFYMTKTLGIVGGDKRFLYTAKSFLDDVQSKRKLVFLFSHHTIHINHILKSYSIFLIY